MINRLLYAAVAVSTGCLVPEDGTATAPQGADHGVVQALKANATPKTWTPLANPAPFGAGVPLLMLDGTLMVHGVGTEAWWRLTPDANGSYVNGTWDQRASLPSGDSPTYFGSAVLPDGRVIVEGGEYINNAQVLSTLGAIYDPMANTWTAVSPPAGWANIGDASGMVLPNGTFMISNALTNEQALFDAANLTWTPTGAGKADVNDEEGWVLLPDDTIITVDCGANRDHAEIYDPATGMWTAAGAPLAPLVDPTSEEIGPAVLRPDGTVFLAGGTGHNAVYDFKSKTFLAAPDLPVVGQGQLDIADGPAALLPNGNVLLIASPGVFNPPLHVYEWDGTSLTEVGAPPAAPSDTSFSLNMLVLPTGEILLTDFTSDVEVYTPAPGISDNAIPLMTAVPKLVTQADPDPRVEEEELRPTENLEATAELLPVTTIYASRTYKLRGTQLHGISQGAYYGDDNQSYTNYPIVQFTNTTTHHVTYARTHDHSTMSIRPGLASTTRFDVPATAERGISNLVVIANGIASPPMLVNIK
jgi:hypothetical protein